VLLSQVFREICDASNLRFLGLLGEQKQIPLNADVILFGHSIIDFDHITKPFVGIHIIRDPRDIIVSGYAYHRRTAENWCVNSDLNNEPPIRFPKVPISQQHRSEEWKMKYLESLGGMSYQDNLLSLSQRDGLLFEMNNYGAWTIESMSEWDYSRDNILEITFEGLMKSYDDTFRMIFERIGFSESDSAAGLRIAAKHDLGRKSTEEISKLSHVSSPKTTKWKEYFETQHKEEFLNKFGDILIRLGYETSDNW
jgi:hypothetical protein